MRPADPAVTRSEAAGYDAVSGAFARLSERFSTPLARRMISLARLAGPERVLDVGTGTGIVALEAARALGAAGAVVGVDVSQGMLAEARARAAQAALGNLDFRRLDAEALDLPDRSFDAVTSLFALFHFSRPLAALREMRRVLRPDGRLVVGVGCGPPPLSWARVVGGVRSVTGILREWRGRRLTAPRILEALVEERLPASSKPEAPLLVHGAAEVLAMVREAGFAGARWTWQGHEAVVGSPEEFWELQQTFSSVVRTRLQSASLEAAQALRAEFLRLSAEVQARGGDLVYPYGAFFVAASRPPGDR